MGDNIVEQGKSPEGWDVRIVRDPRPREPRYRVEWRDGWQDDWHTERESNDLAECVKTYDELMS